MPRFPMIVRRLLRFALPLLLTLGVRAEALAFGGNVAGLLKVLSPTSLVNLIDESDPDASDADKTKLIRNLARLSYTWGPYLQVGVSF